MYTFEITFRYRLASVDQVVRMTAEYYTVRDGDLFFHRNNEDRPYATFAAGAWATVVRNTDTDRTAISEFAKRVSGQVEQALQDELAAL